MSGTIYLRFYEELNDFLTEGRRKRRFAYAFDGPLTVGDLLERLGVPAGRVEIVLADGDSVGLSHAVKDGESLSCYPVFELLDVRTLLRLRREPLRHLRFLTAGGLPGLARYLRLCGFDTLDRARQVEAAAGDAESGGRVILFKGGAAPLPEEASRAWRIRGAKPRQQLVEVLDALSLAGSIIPMGRCPACNAPMADPAEESQSSEAGPPPATRTRWCRTCGRTFGRRYVRRAAFLLKAIMAGIPPSNAGQKSV